MSRAESNQARTSFKKVQAILHRDWDPIGCGVPLDEYDSYAWPVLSLLQKKAGRREVETYLRRAADENMQCSVPDKRLAAVLDKLMALEVG